MDDRRERRRQSHPSGRRPMGREEVRLRLRATCPPSEGSALVPAAGAPAPATGPQGVPAAVLVGLLGYHEGPRVVLTQRTAHLKDHAAQISFPGGRIEAVDDGPAAAALREAYEEIGLAPEKVELLGCLPLHETVSGFLVHPFVGWIEPPVRLTLDRREVAEVFEVPLDFVLDPANHRWESKVIDGVLRSYYVFPYPGHRIWGATAGMLVSLARTLTS